MIAGTRSVSRLPLHLFSNLSPVECTEAFDGTFGGLKQDWVDPEVLRTKICAKLRQAHQKRKQGETQVNADSLEAVSVGQLIQYTSYELLWTLSPILTYCECQELIRRLFMECSVKPKSALSAMKECKYNVQHIHERPSNWALKSISREHGMIHIPSGVKALDERLRGGFRIATITEVIGRSGVGKTQLALQLCVTAAKLGQGTIYIDTEQKMSLKRLEQISSERYASSRADNDDMMPFKHPRTVLQNVTLHKASDTQDLLDLVLNLEEEIAIRNEESRNQTETFPVRLVVIDSIAATWRKSVGQTDAFQRAQILMSITQTLKRLAHEQNLAFVVINQAGQEEIINSEVSGTNSSLGLTWNHCVSTRLFLQSAQGHEQPQEKSQIIRKATIDKSNTIERSSVWFDITNLGIVDANSFT